MSDDLVEIARGSHGEAWYADETMKEPRLLQHVLADEITRLRAALATARREGKVEGIEWAAGMIRAFTKIAEKMADGMGLERSAEKAVEFAVGKVLEEAAAIRAAAGEVK